MTADCAIMHFCPAAARPAQGFQRAPLLPVCILAWPQVLELGGFRGDGVVTLAFGDVQVTRQWHTPIHLMGFLDDARERNVLRTVGPAYQFRHARLQDRLAAATKVMVPPQAASRPTSTPAATADHEH